MRTTLIACAFIVLAACQKPALEQQQPSANEAAAAPATGEESQIKGVHRDNKGKPAPDVRFNDPSGKPTTLAAFAGKPVLVNMWASWCAPCVKELPTLDTMSKRPGALRVIAISQDIGPHASVVAFLQSHKIANLEAYQDPKMALSGKLGAEVLPTSILYDANGREVWRYVGDLDWNGPEATKLLAEAGAPAAH
jgi:thiol-disulfide isomerase/thioredoxin